MHIEYSVEESPLGTAGSVRLASRQARRHLPRHLRRRALRHRPGRARRVPPREGRRGHDRPQVGREPARVRDRRHRRGRPRSSASSRSRRGARSSRTRSTPGIYVLEPEVLQHVPDRPAVRLLEGALPAAARDGPAAVRLRLRRLLAGHRQPRPVPAGELRRARRAGAARRPGHPPARQHLDRRGRRDRRPRRDRGAGVHRQLLPDRARGASVGPYSVLAASVTLRERARTTRSVIDASTHIGRSALVEGAIIGRSCDIRSHVRIHEGVAIGDEVTLGAQSVVLPGVRIYPYKEVESGAQIHESLIWESRALVAPLQQGRRRRARQRRPDAGDRPCALAAALGTALEARRPRRRQPRVAAGLPDDQAGDDHRPELDRRRRRRPARAPGRGQPPPDEDAGLRRGLPRRRQRRPTRSSVQIRFFEQPGIQLTPALQKEVEKHFTRQELRRVAVRRRRRGHLPGARRARRYAQDLLAALDVEAIRGARLPDRRRLRLLGRLVRAAAPARPARRRGGLGARVRDRGGATARRRCASRSARRSGLVSAVGADLGVVFDRAAERLYLIDEQGREIPVEQALLLFLRLIGARRPAGASSRSRSPSRARSTDLVEGSGLEVVRTPASLAELTRTAARGRRRLRRRGRRRLRLPGVPARPTTRSRASASCSSCSAPVERPLSELVAELPRSTLVHRSSRARGRSRAS